VHARPSTPLTLEAKRRVQNGRVLLQIRCVQGMDSPARMLIDRELQCPSWWTATRSTVVAIGLSSGLPHVIRLTTRKGMPWLHAPTRMHASDPRVWRNQVFTSQAPRTQAPVLPASSVSAGGDHHRTPLKIFSLLRRRPWQMPTTPIPRGRMVRVAPGGWRTGNDDVVRTA
jgi:hypothetical protein